MGCEIEIKARIESLDEVFSKLSNLPYSTYTGTVDKTDIYWAKALEGPLLFRTRLQNINKEQSILVTSKPSKSKDCGTELNVENEFELCPDQWDNVMEFCEGLNLVHYRHKYKKGHQFVLKKNSSVIHAELFEVRYLGFFLEMEICGDSFEAFNTEQASEDLRLVLDDLGISRDAIESRGYSKLLEDVGQILG